MAGEAERVDVYLDTIKRLEPDIAMIDQGAAAASIAISLKRIADALEAINAPTPQGENFAQAVYYAIYNSISNAGANR